MDFKWLMAFDWLKSFNLIAALLGGLIVWIISQLKSIKDLQKQSLENTALKVSLIEKLISIDKEQREQLEKLNQLVNKFLQAITIRNIEEAKKIRIDLYEQLNLGYIGSYYRYYKLARWIEGRSGAREIAHFEMLPFLETCMPYVLYLNREDVLKLLNTTFLPFHPSTFSFALLFIKSNTRFWDWDIKKRIKRFEEFYMKYRAF